MNWKRLRKPVAIIAALALVVGLFPAYAVADSTGGDAGGAGTANVANDKGDVNGNDAEPASGEKAPAGEEQTPAIGEKAAVEGQAPTAEEKAPAPKSGVDNAPALKAGDANAAKGDVPTAEPTRGAETHSVFVNNQDSRGSCTVSPGTEVAEGQDLVVTVSPKEGWKVKSIRFQRQASPYTELEYTTSGNTYTVTMPDCDVWLGIEYEPATDAQKYRISFEGDYNQVSFSVDYYEYERPEGDLVTVTSEGLNGYILTSVSVKETESGATVPLGGEYGTTFTMPAADVTIVLEAEYKGDCGFAIGYVGDGSGMAALHDGFGNYHYASGTMNVTATAGYTVELSAEPADGYRFVGWYEGVFQEDSSQPLYGFIYDYDENTCYSTNANYSYTLSASNATAVCAVFEESSSHTVTFDAQGGSPVPEQQEVDHDGYATKPVNNPLKDGVYFLGWFEKPGAELTYDEVHSGGFKFSDTPITEDKTLYAVWYAGFYGATYDLSAPTPKYADTGGDAGFTATYQQKPYPSKVWWNYSIVQGSQVTITATPATGARFVGWAPGTLDADSNMPNDPSTLGDIVSTENPYTFTFDGKTALAALFEQATVTVTFDAKGGTPEPEAQTFEAGGKATEPEAPAKGDWSFAEWYTDESYESSCLFGFDNPVAEDTTLYARWNGRLTVAAFDKTNDEPGGGSFDCETISGTVENADLYTVGTVAEGTPFALTAKPAEGYRFVGWAKGSADGEVVSDKERYEPAAGFDETNLEFYAVFERIPVTVTFDTEGGIPEVGQQDLYYGDKATQPASDATGKSGWNFAGWYTEDGQLFDFNTAITEDTTLHAKWRGTIGFFSINDSEERPGGGGKITIDAEEITSVKYVTVNENDALTATAIPENGYVFVGWAILGNNEFPFHNWTIDSTNATETFTAASQPMTVCAVFKEKPPVLTLHASSVEGDDFIDPIEIEVVKGATIAQALEQYAAGTSLASKLFQKESYQDKGYRTPKPMGDYASYSELWGATVSGDTVLEGDFDLYYSMVKEIDAIELDIEAPVCGTSTDVPEGAYWWEDQTNPPKVSTSGENYTLDNEDGFLPAVWIISAGNDNPYKGDFVGGEEYFAEVWCIPNFGYTFAEDASVTVNGGECVEPLYDGNWFGAYVKVVAAHDPAEAVEENVAAPTCTEAGSHDEVMYCNACGAEVSRETIEDAALGHDWGEWTQTKAPTCTEPGEEARECGRCDENETHEVDALGHDWGEWEVVKEATDAADGLEQRTCVRCGEVEERPIPHIDVEYRCVAGDGGLLTFGSGETLSFIFKRNVNDETSFSHFVGISIDGKVVDKSNYTAKPGSVIVTLEPSFAKTLSVGDHTIEAMFNDGNNAAASFTVTAASEEETTPAEEKPADKAASDESKESPKTGDTLPMGAVGLTAIAAAAVLAFAWRKRRA